MRQTSKWFIFALLAVAQFMVVLDVSIVNVALPAIKQGLSFTPNALSWVITAYALTFGGFLLLGGRAADLFGRKKVLLAGMLGFTLFSLLIGLAQSSGELIVLRALQGLAAALMSPAALSIVLITFNEGGERNKALGLWTTMATAGAATGLILGGLLTQYLNWRWNFFVNVPVGLLVSLGIMRFVPKHQRTAEHNDLDLPGAILITSGLISFVYAVSQAPIWGWLNGKTVGLMALAVALVGSFIFNEARSKHPLMPLNIFKIRNLSGANLMMTPIYAGMMGMFFLVSLYVSTILHFSPVITGLSFLPFPVIVSLVSGRVAKQVGKIGFRPFLIAGPILTAVAIAWLSRIPVSGNYFVDVLPAILLMPIGMGLTFMPVMVAATSGVPANQAGLASGLINTSQQMGGALGLAILSGVAASVANIQGHTLAGVVKGYQVAFSVAVLFVAFAVILAITVIRQPRASQQPQMAAEGASAH